MIWSRLTRRSHLSPYLRTLQNASLKSRCLSIVPEGSTYKFINFNTGIQHNLTCKIRLSSFMHEFSTKSFRQCYRSSAFASQHVGRSCSIPTVRQFSSHASKEQKSQKMLLYLTGLVFAMVGSTYAAVPLYRRFCQATGYGGTVQRRETVEEKIARHDKDKSVTSREIVVQFNADIADGMQWKFVPTQREVRVKPGESALAFYTAENKSSNPITGVSTYNVTPMKILPPVLLANVTLEPHPSGSCYVVSSSEKNLLHQIALHRLDQMHHFLSCKDPYAHTWHREQKRLKVLHGSPQPQAAVYFNKIQCFCFEEQRLLPGEQIDMPVFFYIDPEIETDPRMDGINNIILSYTFFKVSEE